MVDEIEPYNLPLWLFHDKTLKKTLDLTCELGTVEQNSLTPNSRICVALETYEQESPETQQHDMIIVWRKTFNAYEESTKWSSKIHKVYSSRNKILQGHKSENTWRKCITFS